MQKTNKRTSSVGTNITKSRGKEKKKECELIKLGKAVAENVYTRYYSSSILDVRVGAVGESLLSRGVCVNKKSL